MCPQVDVHQVRAERRRRGSRAVLGYPLGGVHEQVLVRLDVLQRHEPARPGLLQVLLQGVEEHAGGFRRGAEPHVLDVRVQHEGDVGGDVHPLARPSSRRPR